MTDILAETLERVREERATRAGHAAGRLPALRGMRHKTCQFIAGEGRRRRFCGRAVKPGSSYCPAHHARCYRGLRGRAAMTLVDRFVGRWFGQAPRDRRGKDREKAA